MTRSELTDGWSIALPEKAEREDDREDGVILLWIRDLTIELQLADSEVVDPPEARRNPHLTLYEHGVTGRAHIVRDTNSDGSFTAALFGVAACDGQTVFLRISFLEAESQPRAISAWRSLRRRRGIG